VKKTFATMHARTFCHATEDLDKVESALENTVGKLDIEVVRTEGHHGNPIMILETTLGEADGINGIFSKLRKEDIERLLGSLDSRIDDGCNFFIRIDKQAAYTGEIRLASNDDVISLRLKVSTFPARREIASSVVKGYLEKLLSGRE